MGPKITNRTVIENGERRDETVVDFDLTDPDVDNQIESMVRAVYGDHAEKEQ